MPDNILSQEPARIAQGKGKTPRDTEHVFGFRALHMMIERNCLPVATSCVLPVTG